MFVFKTKLLHYVSMVLLIWANEFVQERSCEPSNFMSKMQMVRNNIFQNYDIHVRPMNGTNTTDVLTAIWPRQIISLDEELAIFTMDSYILLSWFDPRLQWNISDYKGYLQITKDKIWTPDISVHNSHSLQVDPTQEVLLSIEHTGHVYWVPPIQTQTSCSSVSQVPYPQDEVSCVVVFGSWMHDGWEINYEHGTTLEMTDFLDINPRWKVIDSSVFRNVTIFECCPEPYLSIEVTITMKRRPVPEIEASRAACILVMILTLCIFWLPPDSSHKLLLGGFLFVVLNVLLVYVASKTTNPLAVLFAVSYLHTTMYLVFSAILFQVLIVIKISSLSGPSRPPPTITQFLKGSFGKYACLQSPMSEDSVSLDQVQLKEDTFPVEKLSARDEWMLFAAALDRAMFLVMSVVMIVVHHL